MDYRAPSSLAATDTVLRRRSGVYLHGLDEAEDDMLEGDLHRRPTVLLVRQAPSSPSLPALVQLSSRSPSPPVSICPAHVDEPERSLTPVPLAPHPNGPQRAHSEASFQPTSTDSTMAPLPTPDFTPPPRFLSRFPRRFSIFSPPPHLFCSCASSPESQLTGTEASSSRPQSLRSDSQESSSAGSTDSGSNSVDSGHHALIKAVGTTDKFTHKWPRPQSLRAHSVGHATDSTSFDLLEDGRGFAMDTEELWTVSKWCLLLSVCMVFVYGAAALVCALMTWFRMWDQADVMYVADNDVLILITLTGSLLVFTALVGLSGVLLNSRPILAVYTVLLWPAFVSLVSIGYVAYKRATFSLDHKLNLSWSQYYTPLGRLFIQDSLWCCGFYSALHEATPSKRCYPRTSLPGCKGKLYRFERANLVLVWSTVFSLVPLHLLNLLVALLCSNHVTETFGKGIAPERYHLTNFDVQVDAEKIMGRIPMPSEHRLSSRVSAGALSREDTDGEDRVPFLSYDGHQY